MMWKIIALLGMILKFIVHYYSWYESCTGLNIDYGTIS